MTNWLHVPLSYNPNLPRLLQLSTDYILDRHHDGVWIRSNSSLHVKAILLGLTITASLPEHQARTQWQRYNETE